MEREESQELVQIVKVRKQQVDQLLGTVAGWGWGKGRLLHLGFSLCWLCSRQQVALISEPPQMTENLLAGQTVFKASRKEIPTLRDSDYSACS